MEISDTATRTELTVALTRAGRTERPMSLVSKTGTQLGDLICEVWQLEQAWPTRTGSTWPSASHKRALAAALATFSREIGADTVAEGIETEAELATIRELGIQYGQGYLFGKPEIPGGSLAVGSVGTTQLLG